MDILYSRLTLIVRICWRMMVMKTIRMFGVALVLLLALAPISAPAYHGGHGHWRFHAGAWAWWAVPGPFYYRPYPYPYLYPSPYAPSTVVIERTAPAVQPLQPQQQFWYYCESAKSYYPYVPSCQEGWKMVPTTPPAPGVPTQ